jgi:predicted porin
VLEYRLDPNLNQGVGSAPTGMTAQSGPARQQLLGLTNADFGTIAAGRLQTTAYDWEVSFDPLAGSSISALQFANSGFNIGTIAGHARANNALAYISPAVYGVTLAVNYALASENTGTIAQSIVTTGTVYPTGTPVGQPSTQASAFLLSLNTKADNLAAGFVYDKQSANTAFSPLSNQLDIATGLSYDFGVVKLLGTLQTHKTSYAVVTAAAPNSESADRAYSLSGVVPLGTDAVVGQVGRLVKASSEPANKSVTGYTLAYTHAFSKTTTLYGSYSHVADGINATTGISAYGSLAGPGDAKAAWSPTPGGSASLFTVGVKKSF